MLCSNCHKNMAVIFTKKIDGDKSSMEGLCYNCAKEKGINPLEVLAKQANLSEDELNDMSKQFENLFGDIAQNIDIENINPENMSEDGGIPLGSIFSNMFGDNSSTGKETESDSSGKRKVKTEKRPKEKKKSFLDIYGTNLTNKARKNELDIVIGRDKEIERVIQILNRRSKNNPCLIGEPGVGKTAIAQGLAIKIAEKKVPAKLLNKEVYLLDMTAVVAGTQFRGQFESRMKAIIDECKSCGNIILVIDEIHNIICNRDVLCVSSSFETFCIPIVEAFASGIPVITTNCTGPLEIVDKSNSVVVPINDINLFADAIIDVMNNYKKYNSKEIKKYAYEKYDKSTISKKIIKICEDVINKKKSIKYSVK